MIWLYHDSMIHLLHILSEVSVFLQFRALYIPTNSGGSFLNATFGIWPFTSAFTLLTVFLLSSEPSNYFLFRYSCRQQAVFFFLFLSGNKNKVNLVMIITFFLKKTMCYNRKSRDVGLRVGTLWIWHLMVSNCVIIAKLIHLSLFLF